MESAGCVVADGVVTDEESRFPRLRIRDDSLRRGGRFGDESKGREWSLAGMARRDLDLRKNAWDRILGEE